jgi:hypothetical protein
MSPAYVEILEGEPAVHSNILFPLSDRKRAERWITNMSSSILFPEDTLDIQDAEGAQWFVSYCSKERVSKATYVGGAGALMKRRKGVHKLGDGGGDRVRLSEPLESALVARGLATLRTRAYAKGLPKARIEPPLVHLDVDNAPAMKIEVRFRESLFDGEPLPVLAAPEKPKGPPGKRERIPAPSLPMEYPPSIADMFPGLGPTHQAIAERVGLSRPQVTNIIVGRFGVSRQIVRRVLELELARAA